MVKETALLARLKAGDYRVVSTALEGVARSDGGELSDDMRRWVEETGPPTGPPGFDVTEGQVLTLEWGVLRVNEHKVHSLGYKRPTPCNPER